MLAWCDTIILMVEKAEQEPWMILRRGSQKVPRVVNQSKEIMASI
jgi:hypothetical protein